MHPKRRPVTEVDNLLSAPSVAVSVKAVSLKPMLRDSWARLFDVEFEVSRDLNLHVLARGFEEWLCSVVIDLRE